MRRADAWLMIVVGAFAVFVGVQVVTRDTGRPAPRTATASTTASADTSHRPAPADTSGPSSDAPTTVTQANTPAPVRNLDDVHARIAAASDTYISDMLADMDETLVRWPDLRQRGLRIWVQSITTIPGWDLRYAQMARDAFADWGGDGLPMRFDFVLDSATSDIHIVWTDRFPPSDGLRVGTTRRAVDQNGWLARAEIVIAIHDSAGNTIPPDALAGIVRHEAGHALGLGHSHNQHTKMYPVEMVDEITPLDRATLRLLYELPPGKVQ